MFMHNILNVLLIIFGIYSFAVWIHALATYDWSKFDEDSEGDDFLKPIDNAQK